MATSGIDVSEWQGVIDWAKAKSQIDFALIRAGYGDTLSYPTQIDYQYERNYSECKRLGIPVGVYFYCYARTTAEAEREADSCLALLKGKTFEFPIYYDVEEMSVFKTGKTGEICKAFIDKLEKAGYWVGVYTYRSAMGYFPSYIKDKKAMAIAEYASQLHYSGQYGIWQNSSSYAVSGISGRVDHDFCYVDYPKLIKENGKNGYPAPAPKLMYKVTKQTPIVNFEGEAIEGKTYQVYGRKTVDGVQYGRVTANGWISLKDAKQV